MSNPIIKIKRSSVEGKQPGSGDLPLGELALNTYDGRLYVSKSTDSGVSTSIVNVSGVQIQDEGTIVGYANTLNFVGSGVTVLSFSDGVGIVSITGGGGGSSFFTQNATGIHTLGSVGVGTTNATGPADSNNTSVLNVGVVTANYLYGDGAGITGISAIARVTVSQTPPSSPTAGDLWYHSTLARLFVYFTDADSSQWVDASPFNLGGGGSGGTNVSVGATAPTSPTSGDLWYSSDHGRLFVYYIDEDSNQWVDASPFNLPINSTPTRSETSFTATAGQTTFTVSYEVGYVEVYLNGIRLSSDEYTATNGSTVVLDDAATAGDVVDIVEIATNRGQTGARGPAGATTLAGIGTTSVSTTHYPVFISGLGNTTPLISTTSNYFGFIPESGTLTVNQFVVAGVATATDFNSSSDINLKKDVKVIDDPVAKVMQLNGVSFNWTDTGQSSAGVIAQDVEKVMPEIIRDNPTGYKSLNYNGLIGLLIEAVKEQNETIKSLEQKINTLEERLG